VFRLSLAPVVRLLINTPLVNRKAGGPKEVPSTTFGVLHSETGEHYLNGSSFAQDAKAKLPDSKTKPLWTIRPGDEFYIQPAASENPDTGTLTGQRVTRSLVRV